MLKSLINMFRRGDRSFNELETKILEAVKEKLPENMAEIFSKRIDAINLVQRTNDLQEVNCYEMCRGKVLFRPEHQTSTSSGESKMASFSILSPSGNIICGDIWSVDGVFFSIEFSKSPLNVIWDDSYHIAVDVL